MWVEREDNSDKTEKKRRECERKRVKDRKRGGVEREKLLSSTSFS